MILPITSNVCVKNGDTYDLTEVNELRPRNLLQGTSDAMVMGYRKYTHDGKSGVYAVEFESGKIAVIEQSQSVFVADASTKGKAYGFPVKDLHEGVQVQVKDGAETVKSLALHFASVILFTVDIVEPKENQGVYVDEVLIKV